MSNDLVPEIVIIFTFGRSRDGYLLEKGAY